MRLFACLFVWFHVKSFFFKKTALDFVTIKNTGNEIHIHKSLVHTENVERWKRVGMRGWVIFLYRMIRLVFRLSTWTPHIIRYEWCTRDNTAIENIFRRVNNKKRTISPPPHIVYMRGLQHEAYDTHYTMVQLDWSETMASVQLTLSFWNWMSWRVKHPIKFAVENKQQQPSAGHVKSSTSTFRLYTQSHTLTLCGMAHSHSWCQETKSQTRRKTLADEWKSLVRTSWWMEHVFFPLVGTPKKFRIRLHIWMRVRVPEHPHVCGIVKSNFRSRRRRWMFGKCARSEDITVFWFVVNNQLVFPFFCCKYICVQTDIARCIVWIVDVYASNGQKTVIVHTKWQKTTTILHCCDVVSKQMSYAVPFIFYLCCDRSKDRSAWPVVSKNVIAMCLSGLKSSWIRDLSQSH